MCLRTTEELGSRVDEGGERSCLKFEPRARQLSVVLKIIIITPHTHTHTHRTKSRRIPGGAFPANSGSKVTAPKRAWNKCKWSPHHCFERERVLSLFQRQVLERLIRRRALKVLFILVGCQFIDLAPWEPTQSLNSTCYSTGKIPHSWQRDTYVYIYVVFLLLFFTSADERARCGYGHSNLGELSEGFSHLNKDAVAPRRSSPGYSSLPRRNSVPNYVI